MDFIRISEFIGLGGFVLWALQERGFYSLNQQQKGGIRENRRTYWVISLFWYGTMIYSILDVWSWTWTTFKAGFVSLRLAGVILITSGIIIRFLARRTLGKQYSVHVETSDKHKLIITGIFNKIRHPAYLGLLFLLLGIPLALGSAGGILIAIIGGVPAVIYRIRIEEKYLASWFGKQYDDYQQNTWKLIPYLW
jgi:protein-S-isoprenylcysteine O-methyltransferase Ste14